MALNLAPFGRWTLRDKAAQRRLALRYTAKEAPAMTIKRVVRAYSNSTERELWSLPIHDFNLEAFQVEFQAEVSDPMYDCWPITQKNLPFLSRHIVNPHGLDFINCAYFIEAEAT